MMAPTAMVDQVIDSLSIEDLAILLWQADQGQLPEEARNAILHELQARGCEVV